MEEEERIASLSNLDWNAMDMDRWEIFISCQEYLDRLKDTVAMVCW